MGSLGSETWVYHVSEKDILIYASFIISHPWIQFQVHILSPKPRSDTRTPCVIISFAIIVIYWDSESPGNTVPSLRPVDFAPARERQHATALESGWAGLCLPFTQNCASTEKNAVSRSLAPHPHKRRSWAGDKKFVNRLYLEDTRVSKNWF